MILVQGNLEDREPDWALLFFKKACIEEGKNTILNPTFRTQHRQTSTSRTERRNSKR